MHKQAISWPRPTNEGVSQFAFVQLTNATEKCQMGLWLRKSCTCYCLHPQNSSELCCRSAQKRWTLINWTFIFSQTQTNNNNKKILGVSRMPNENSSCKEAEMEREGRWKLLFNHVLSMRNSLQFIEAAMGNFRADHLKRNHLKACTWNAIRERKDNKIDKRFLCERNSWYTVKHHCTLLTKKKGALRIQAIVQSRSNALFVFFSFLPFTPPFLWL